MLDGIHVPQGTHALIKAGAGSMTAICISQQAAASETALMGLARLMTMAFRSADLMPLATRLIARASADEDDANALMDLSTILLLQGITAVGLATQAQALQIKRHYELPAARPQAVRLLALMAPGDLMTNTPLPFLVEDSDIALSMLYVMPGEPFPRQLPEHDVLFVAVSESNKTRVLLERLSEHLGTCKKPVLNRPDRIARTSRAQAYSFLLGEPGICMPPSVRAQRAELMWLSADGAGLDSLLPDGGFPLIIRPVDSHAGHGLAKVDGTRDLSAYLEASSHEEFFISRFIDYSGADGLFRKYRVVLIQGMPFCGHMGVSSHWMIHYLNAGMTDSAEKRRQEECFMQTFSDRFAQRHRAALSAIAERFALDYLVIDCAETRHGDLLVFEVDPGAVVHSMDPVDLFPYKRRHMEMIFAAFRELLVRSIAATQ